MRANELRGRRIRPMQLLQATAFALSLGVLAACESMPKAIADLPLVGKDRASMPSPVGPLASPAARTSA